MPISVLLVEDNRLIAFNMQTQLKLQGHTVVTSHSSAEALQAARSFRPDIVIMDVNLSEEIDGINVMKRIHNEIGFIPNIYLTGYAIEELSRRAESTSPVAIMEKPIDNILLAKVIEALASGPISEG